MDAEQHQRADGQGDARLRPATHAPATLQPRGREPEGLRGGLLRLLLGRRREPPGTRVHQPPLRLLRHTETLHPRGRHPQERLCGQEPRGGATRRGILRALPGAHRGVHRSRHARHEQNLPGQPRQRPQAAGQREPRLGDERRGEGVHPAEPRPLLPREVVLRRQRLLRLGL